MSAYTYVYFIFKAYILPVRPRQEFNAKIVCNMKSIMKVSFFFLFCGFYIESISGSMDACQDEFWRCRGETATLNGVRSVKRFS